MWILENEGGAFEGKRLWLRPGKRYLFGRTVAEPGQLAIKGDPAALKSVSRKHCTIRVDEVTEGDGQKPSSRSRVTIEDLGSKSGTRINDRKLKGDTYVLTEPENTLQMGSFQDKFKITWFPVVLSYSFSSKELRASPFTKLQQNLEQLDIKYLADYDARWTTHVVHKKRNTPKGLQALINGNYIVNDSFVNAILAATAPEHVSDGVDRSLLEADFDGNWPHAIQFLPATGDDAAPIPNEQFSRNPARADIFDGYTFVFYEKKQFDFLMAPITTGKGKALLKEVIPEETQIDDFIRYVKGVAGEKGLGEFEDGSEGKGVVVVQFMPTNQEHLEWYTQFYTSVSLRLDQRLITQKDFLPAILNNDASGLRRPLEEETEEQQRQQHTTHADKQPATAPEVMDVDDQPPVAPLQPLARRRQRGAAKSRFRGFGVTLDDEDEPTEAPVPPAPAPAAAEPESSQEGLFVSQPVQSQASEVPIRNTRLSQRKRPAAHDDSEEILDGFAPTAAEVKRRRIAAGEDPTPRETTPAPPEAAKQQQPAAKTPKIKKEIDILDVARQHREEVEARAKAEREDLATAPEGLDLAEIRRLHIEEPMPLRQVAPERTRDQDVADGRWDPAWNGRKNFKRFQRRGAVQGRAPPRIIVPLGQVQAKAYGIGDDYWLENDSMTSQAAARKKKKTDSISTPVAASISQARSGQSRSQTPSENPNQSRNVRAASRGASATAASGASARSLQSTNTSSKRIEGLAPVDSSEVEEDGDGDGDGDMQLDDNHDRQAIVGEDDDDDDDDIIAASAPRSTRSARGQSATTTTTQPSQRSSRSTANTTAAATAATAKGKRPAMAPPLTTARAKPAKRPKILSIADSDDESEDELRFRFGRR
ncbi:hypothetical protein SLS62_000916 [Diatrype stigma]|uniref:FHA domain-containing protein n=1 Tax=Diatrype stigma TaxID=117547 RepID=A0AAN9UWR1_9PEZI